MKFPLLRRIAAFFYAYTALVMCQASLIAATTDGALRMEVITAYNFVVDSNIESPSGKSPSAAHLGVKIYNDGPVPLTNVVVNIGDLLNPGTGSGTPGVFESRTVTVSGANGYSGTFQLQMPSGPADATRIIPVIQPGEYVAQYFFVTYPLKDPSGNSVAGAAPVPEDDLWLNYDIWASANDGVTTRRVDQTTKVTMRNEISAMANKIWPNTTGKVPDEYLDAIEASLGWRPQQYTPRIPGASMMEGIWYDLGNVGAGFDNNGDGLPDRNAWMQPVGDPTRFSALAARLVKCYGIVIVKLNDGTEMLIPFEDKLYFENVPGNNTNAVGLVFYEFMPLDLSNPSQMSPYQEVASGYDNEKFNGDYGTAITLQNFTPPDVSLDKTGPTTTLKNSTVTYTLTASNNRTDVFFGWSDLSLPVVFQDTVPAGLQYVAGSATSANLPPSGQFFTVTWSTDGGTTWSSTEPADGTLNVSIRWVLSGSLSANNNNPGGNDQATVSFQARVPVNYTSVTVNNTGCVGAGTTSTTACDTVTTRVLGDNALGDFVWRDLDRDGVQDGGAETGIANIGVSLYFDADGDGVLDNSDPLFETTSTNGSGGYSFTQLPDGKYIVVVDQYDAQLPLGYSLLASVSGTLTADLDSLGVSGTAVTNNTLDWPFIPALEIVKSTTPSSYLEGQLVTFNIDLENHSAPVPAAVSAVTTVWAPTVTCKPARTTAVVPANAQGAPNDTFARIDFRQDADFLEASGFSYTTSNTITKVEMVFRAYVDAPITNDTLLVRVKNGAGGTYSTQLTISKSSTSPTGNVTLDGLVGPAQTYVVDVTGFNATWTQALVQGLYAELESNKVSAGDNSIIWVDGIGLRVTTSVPPPSTGTYGPNTIDPLPLTDTYEANRLQFVSASETPDSTSVVGNAGTLTWNNLGPLNAGVRKTITVTFLALNPGDTVAPIGQRDTITTINNATATNAYFVDGRRTNDDTDPEQITIAPAGSIGDTVWWDTNGNGIKETGEVGLNNVRVYILETGAQQFTNSNGQYLFTNLPDGTYTVVVDTTTLPLGGFTQVFDPDGTLNNKSTVTINNADSLTTNDTYLDRDFGYDTNTSSLISGIIFTDHDGDGIQDPGDNVLSGVTVRLTAPGGAITNVTTNSSGYYQFPNLTVAGAYTVSVPTPPTSTQTLDPDGTLNNQTTVNVTLGNVYPNRDFAYRATGLLTLGDTVYYDWNGDGDQDVGEAGISGVTVSLYEDANGDGAVDPLNDALITTDVTDGSGVYGFSNLAAGTYIVVVDTSGFPSGYVQTQDYDGFADNKATVNLTSSLNTVDFGYQPTGTGVLGNLVWFDANNNGLKDVSESGINNVTVELYLASQTPGVSTPVASTVTSGGGIYGFTGLAPENYVIYIPASNFTGGGALVSTPASSSVTSTTDNAIDNDDNGQQTIAGAAVTSPVITLGAAETDNTKDFGFTGAGTVGDFVFYDSNANGTQDYTEPGIPNVSLSLFLDLDTNGIPDGSAIATTVTADGSNPLIPAGFYEFTGVPTGTYLVRVNTATLPQVSGFPIPQTSDPDLDGIPVDGVTYIGDHEDHNVIVTSGSSYVGADFGYLPPGAIGDFVWLDLNQDGVQDSGEPGIANVEIQISNGVTSYTVFTDPDGYWSQILADGVWTVTVLPSNFNAGGVLEDLSETFDADGVGTPSVTTVTIVNGDVTVPASLPQGNLGIDFGYKLDGNFSLAGTIAINDNGLVGTADDVDDFIDDGVDMDAGPTDETELSGVEVYLYTLGGSLLGSTVTDSNGDYNFSGLSAGSYRVIIGTTAAPLNNATLTTTTGNNLNGFTVSNTSTSVTQIAVISASNVVDVDFTFLSNVDYDYGDLPASYGMTTIAQDGARHIIPTTGTSIFLGAARDEDTNGVVSALANGDDIFGTDDEDGVVALSPSTWTEGPAGPTTGGKVQVTIGDNLPASSTTGWLVGWIDWNGDGDFLDSYPGGVSEMVVSQLVSTDTTITVSFAIPAGTIDAGSQSWLSRFRLFTSEPPFPLFSYEGETTNGEVEDHLLEKPVGASIGDIVWNDANGDGDFDTNEVGISGIIVQAFDGVTTYTQTTSDGTQDVDNDGVTDPIGYYRFRGLAAGTYTVTVTNPPAAFDPSYDENGIVTPNVTTVVLATDEQHLTADFGYEPRVADLSGQVRYDSDSDGDPLDTDSGASFVRIQLWTDPNGDGDPSDGVQVREEYTDISGNYIFTDVPTGKYVVVEVNPIGSTSTYDVVGANDDRIPVTMLGVDITGRDFLDTTPPLYSISGVVYSDTEEDNVIGGGDTPLPFVLVSLYFDRDGDGVVSVGDTLLASMSTNASGAYTFGGLTSGNYVVQETDPSGATSENDVQGAPTDNYVGVTVTSSNVTGRNFLDDNVSLGSIGDRVWYDANGNSVQDVLEIGLPNVRVYIDTNNNQTYESGEPFDVTDANGDYLIGSLVAGSYTVRVDTDTLAAYSLPTYDLDGVGTPNTAVVSLAALENRVDVDFGYRINCATSYAQFVSNWSPLVGFANTDALDNPDGDVYSNLLEYAFCMPANSGYAPMPPFCVRPDGSGGIEAFMDRPIGLVDVTYTLLVIPDLNNAPAGWAVPSQTLTPTITQDVAAGRELLEWDIDSLPELANGGYAIIRVELFSDSSKTTLLQTGYTEICGWQNTDLAEQCQTYSAPFVNHEFFTGTVDSVVGNTLTLATSANGRNLGDLLNVNTRYYVEVIEGAYEGHRFDVASGAVNTLTVIADADIYRGPAYGAVGTHSYNTLASIPDLTGNLVVLRAHKTLSDVLPPASYTAGDTLETADCVMCWNGVTFDTYWLANESPVPYWTTSANANLENLNSTVIAPAHGLFVYRKTNGPSVTMSGGVRENDFILPLPATQRTLVGAMYPVDQSANGQFTRAMTLANGFTGGGDPARVDQIQIWNGDTVLGNFGFTSHWFRNTTGGNFWTSFVSTLPNMNNSLLFKGDRGAFLKIQQAVDSYRIPSPVARPVTP